MVFPSKFSCTCFFVLSSKGEHEATRSFIILYTEARSAMAECGGLARLFSSLPPQLEPLHVSGVLGAHRSIVSCTVLAIKFNSIVSFSIKPGSGKIPMFHQSNFPFKFVREKNRLKIKCMKKNAKKNVPLSISDLLFLFFFPTRIFTLFALLERLF